jgi:hypothetical protein
MSSISIADTVNEKTRTSGCTPHSSTNEAMICGKDAPLLMSGPLTRTRRQGRSEPRRGSLSRGGRIWVALCLKLLEASEHALVGLAMPVKEGGEAILPGCGGAEAGCRSGAGELEGVRAEAAQRCAHMVEESRVCARSALGRWLARRRCRCTRPSQPSAGSGYRAPTIYLRRIDPAPAALKDRALPLIIRRSSTVASRAFRLAAAAPAARTAHLSDRSSLHDQ